MEKDYRKLIGYIPSPVVNTASFGIPIFHNVEKSCFETQIVEDGLNFITGFDRISRKETILHMIELSEPMERIDVGIGDSPFFVITMNTLIFVGTAEELEPHINGIKEVSGDNFVKELELIPLRNKTNHT